MTVLPLHNGCSPFTKGIDSGIMVSNVVLYNIVLIGVFSRYIWFRFMTLIPKFSVIYFCTTIRISLIRDLYISIYKV